MKRLAFLAGLAAVALWACVEEPTSPARCPDFCPGNKLVAVESLFTDMVVRDSTFQGYIVPLHAGLLPATAEAGIDSRPISQMGVFAPRTQIDSSDTTTGLKVIDSMKLTVRFLRPDTASRNLRISFYQLPDSIDSTTTLADLGGSFAAAPLRVVNVDSLLRQPSRRDSIGGDTVLVDGLTDTTQGSKTTHLVVLRLKFDSAHAPFNAADSGRLSLGVVVTADNKPTLAFTSSKVVDIGGLSASWFYRVDSAGKLLRPDSIFYKCVQGGATNPCPQHPPDSINTFTNFDTFVYSAPAVPADSNLLIGGTPSRRALLRIAFPKKIRDSAQILRAQLLLIPTATPPVALGDSVIVVVNRVFADLGLKSPVDIDTTIQGSSAPFTGNPTDTVRIELTPLFRALVSDTTVPTSVFVRLLALRRLRPVTTGISDTTGRSSSFEGATFTTLRFYSSHTPAFRPMIRLTYVPRIKLGVP